jgi:pimeloyl-ACP methyl ester carboxylesterase
MIINVIIGCAVVAVLLAVLTAIGTVTIERQYPPLGRFVDVTGGRMHVLERGQPDAPVVVLLHGASGNLQDVNAALGAPLAARYRVIMVDRPGHGWSDRPGGDDEASPARQAALIAQALEKLGVTRAILVGVSWSGALATNYALTFPERVAGLVLLAPVSHPWPGGIAWNYRLASTPVLGPLFVRTVLMPLAFPMMDGLVRAAFAPQAMPDRYPERAALPLALRPNDFLANARDVADLKANVTLQAHRYGEIRIPAVIIAGDHDTTVSPDIHSKALAAAMPNARLIILPGVGHIIHHAQAELVIGEIDAIAARVAR